MAELLKGATAVNAIIQRAAQAVAQLRESGVAPKLTLVKVGDRQDDASYERGARKRAEEAGVIVDCLQFAEEVTTEELLAAIQDLNADSGVHGILMFRPLPAHLDEAALCAAIEPAKDVDAATQASLAGVYTGNNAGFAPCTAQAVVEMLDAYGIDVAGKQVVVIGRSQVVGKPAAALLLDRNATVTVCHSKTRNMSQITRQADVVVVATGRAEAFGADYFAPGQTVIDVGINWSDAAGKLVGDVAFAQVEPIVAAISPVPGGVGGVTSAVLIDHVVQAARRSCV